jgi:hypothetical protein
MKKNPRKFSEVLLNMTRQKGTISIYKVHLLIVRTSRLAALLELITMDPRSTWFRDGDENDRICPRSWSTLNHRDRPRTVDFVLEGITDFAFSVWTVGYIFYMSVRDFIQLLRFIEFYIQYWCIDGKYRIYVARLRNGGKNEL